MIGAVTAGLSNVQARATWDGVGAEVGRDVADHIGDVQPTFGERSGRRREVLAALRAIGLVEIGAGVSAGEHTLGQRRPREHAQTHLARHRDQVTFAGPLNQAVFDLQCDQRRQAAQLRDRLLRDTCHAGVSEIPT